MDTLTILESAQLERYERIIEKGIRSFVDVGNALMEIREGRLYRSEFPTFEGYCQERWGLTRQHCNRLISASEVVEHLEPIGSKPTSESQVRPLTKLPPEEQPAAWQEAVETAPEGKPTAKHVAEVVARRIAETTVEPEAEVEDIDDSADIEFDDEGRIVEEASPPDPEKAAKEARRSELRRLISEESEKLVIARMLFDSCSESQRVSVSISWNEWWKEN